MRPQSDDQWPASARARAATAGSAWDIAPDLSPALPRPATAAGEVRLCPYCEEHPALVAFRSETPTAAPLLLCPACYGFWAAGVALSAGAGGPDLSHPALRAATALRRCRACFGHFKSDGLCARCGEALPTLNCPACALSMKRHVQGGVTIDTCGPCRGAWFDTGEIAALYQLAGPGPRLLAGSGFAADGEDTASDSSDLLGLALAVGLRLAGLVF